MPITEAVQGERRPSTDFNMPIGNLQESFFQAALQARSHITVHLLNGVKLSGKVRSFDRQSVILETTTLAQLIFKHSISAAFLCRNRHCPECAPNRSSVLSGENGSAAGCFSS